MLARIAPTPLAGAVGSIASKSMAHRILIAAALADRPTHILCNTTCADIEATARCLEALGAGVRAVADGFEVEPIPTGSACPVGPELDCGESGSTLRFMLPVACAVGAECTFVGAGRLGQRPLGPLADELLAGGAEVHGVGSFPLKVSGRLRPGRFILPGNVSSQYVTGLLLAAPAMPRTTEILVRGRIESRPYIDLTLQVLDLFGVVHSEKRGDEDGEPYTLFTVRGGGYASPGEVAVEGDWSNAAFWLCAGALGRSAVTVTGMSLSSAQGDRSIMAVLSLLGARISRESGRVTVHPDRLRAVEVDARDIPDLVPVISAVACCAEGTTRIRDCARLRIKESDRLQTTTEVLSRLGADISIEGDDLVIHGRKWLVGGTIEAHNDHRIAMMAAVAACRCAQTVVIRGAEAVGKSYPMFFEHYRALGGRVDLERE